MRQRMVAYGVGIACSVTLSAQAPFRSEIAVVSLHVSVRDGRSGHVGDLQPDEFIVFEDGKPQPFTYVAAERVPLSLMLLLDTSGSMHPHMRLAQEAASGLVARLRPADRAAIVDFDSRVRIVQPFTSDGRLLGDAIRGLQADRETSLHTAVYVALKELERTRADQSRQAIVVLTDGEDTSSLVSLDDVMDAAMRSQTAIYTIGLLTPPDRRSSKLAISESRSVLRRLASATGGLSFFPTRAEELSDIYQRVAEELATQYLLAYTPTNTARDGKWRTIAVRISRSGCVARTRPGYYAPKQ
jgi:Ca-activated chloride channel family protein